MRRTTAALAGAATGLVVMASPAWAADPVVSPGIGGGIDTTVELPGSSGGGGPRTQPVGSGSGSGSGGGDAPACTYTRVPESDDPGPPPRQAYLETCLTSGVVNSFLPTGLVYVADAVLPPTVTPEQLAQRARNRMVLPAPTVGLNPPASRPYQLVNFPVWWWVENWAPLTQRTELGGVWAEVTATPYKSRFDGGYGTSKECGQPGIPWNQSLPDSHPHSCQFTYTKASERFDATITMTWRVSWVGSGGSGGVLPLMTTSTAQPLTVYERRTVVVDGRG